MSTVNASPSISVCIATYKRPRQLASLLDDLCSQTLPPSQIIVVDNDPDEGGRNIVSEKKDTAPGISWVYDTQPVKNISLTRNRTMAHADGEWLAFVDDDERVPSNWLELLLDTAQTFKADGVLATVIPIVPPHAPSWIKRGTFYDSPRFPTGTPAPPNALRTGNALIASRVIKHHTFDPRYGITGGGDLDFLLRLRQEEGATFVWCDEAAATEEIPNSRLRLAWLLKRALRGGQDFSRYYLMGQLWPVGIVQKITFFVRALLQMLVALCLSFIYLPVGKAQSLRWLVKASANLGKLSAYFGLHYREYS